MASDESGGRTMGQRRCLNKRQLKDMICSFFVWSRDQHILKSRKLYASNVNWRTFSEAVRYIKETVSQKITCGIESAF
jgi:hypothetical protein